MKATAKKLVSILVAIAVLASVVSAEKIKTKVTKTENVTWIAGRTSEDKLGKTETFFFTTTTYWEDGTGCTNVSTEKIAIKTEEMKQEKIQKFIARDRKETDLGDVQTVSSINDIKTKTTTFEFENVEAIEAAIKRDGRAYFAIEHIGYNVLYNEAEDNFYVVVAPMRRMW